LSFNKIIENQIAQLAATIHVSDLGKNLGKHKFLSNLLIWSQRGGYLVDPPFIAKEDDPGRPTITCFIGPHVFYNTFYDLGASINVMSKVIYDKILGGPLSTANFRLQIEDQSS
jgi:hypothetical protein